VLHLRCSRNWQHDRRFLEQPRQRDLAGRDSKVFSGGCQRTPSIGQSSSRKRKPWNETDAFLCAVFEHILGTSFDQVVQILYGGDGRQALHGLDLLNAYLRKANVADFPFILKRDQNADLVFEGNFGVNAVELEKFNAVEFEAATTPFPAFPDVFGPAVGLLLVRPGSLQASLGSDYDPVRIGMQ